MRGLLPRRTGLSLGMVLSFALFLGGCGEDEIDTGPPSSVNEPEEDEESTP